MPVFTNSKTGKKFTIVNNAYENCNVTITLVKVPKAVTFTQPHQDAETNSDSYSIKSNTSYKSTQKYNNTWYRVYIANKNVWVNNAGGIFSIKETGTKIVKPAKEDTKPEAPKLQQYPDYQNPPKNTTAASCNLDNEFLLDCNLKMRVKSTTKSINIRNCPFINGSDIVGTAYANQEFVALQSYNQWYKFNNTGWVNNTSGDLEIISNNAAANASAAVIAAQTSAAIAAAQVNDQAAQIVNPDELSKIWFGDLNSYVDMDRNGSVDDAVSNLRSIHGMPYQYMASVDKRITPANKTNDEFQSFGRKYTERIVSRMPALVLSPGKPGFMDGFSKSERQGVAQKLYDVITDFGDTVGDSLEGLFGQDNGGKKYYSFQFDYADYYKYVNAAISTSARFLGIENMTYKGKKIGTFRWEDDNKEHGIPGFFSSSEYVCFYMEADDSISDSFDNSTTESMLSGAINGLIEKSREFQFLMGTATGQEFGINPEAGESLVSSFTDKWGNIGHIAQKLRDGVVNVATGATMIFPEIWSGSSFSRSYDILIKLASPDGDDKSIFLNCFVPLYHLLALVMPRSLTPNSFYSPFLVRGFYKGYFNCELGIITNMSVRRGAEGSWNLNGLPTEIEVSFSLKDLYNSMGMSKISDNGITQFGNFVKNTTYLEFLANMVGVNINSPDIGRIARFYAGLVHDKFANFVPYKLTEMSNALSNLSMGFYKTFL